MYMIRLSRMVRFNCGDYALFSSRPEARLSIRLILCFFLMFLLCFRLYPSKMEDSFDCDCGELEPPDH